MGHFRVGNTPLFPLTEVEHPLGDVLVKDEAFNPFCSYRDRESACTLEQVHETGAHTLAVVTSSNGGYSLARMAKGTGLRVATIISDQTRPSIRKALYGAGADVYPRNLQIPLTSEDIETIVRKHTKEVILSVRTGQPDAYKSIYHEIDPEKPNVIVAPLGSGELYMGLHQGMEECKSDALLVGVDVDHPRSKAGKLGTHLVPMWLRIAHEELKDAYEHCIEKRKQWDALESDISWNIAHARLRVSAEPSNRMLLAVAEHLRDALGKTVLINTGKGIL